VKWIVITVVFLVGWEAAWWVLGARPMGPGKLKSLLKAEGERKVQLIDVRTPEEYRWFHIPGAVNRPDLFSHPERLPEESREDHLVFICLSGHRAPVTAFRIKNLGFESVSYLSWGMLAWMLSGGSTVGGSGEQ
jgi:rhodanese-related sulfurtransferase